MRKSLKIMISACELSADKYAANLARELVKKNDAITLFGIGSDASREAGIDIRLDMSSISTVGLVEPLRFIPKLIKAYLTVKSLLIKEKPDLFIVLDNQGFHMKCCKLASSLGIKTVYFIAPQEWHWGTEKKGKKVCEVVDQILAIFPQEEAFYRRCGGHVTFVGHPVTDRLKPYRNKRKATDTLAIFPGSRIQEIERLLPLFLSGAIPIAKKHQLTCVVSVASSQYQRVIEKIIQDSGYKMVEIHSKDSLSLIAKACISIVTSGTISLEHALLGVPHVVSYKFHPLTFWIAQTFFSKTLDKLPFMSMANTLLNHHVFPELLQDKVTTQAIMDQLEHVLNQYHSIEKKCSKLWDTLHVENVSEQAAQTILSDM